jgi:hypothetical protein
MRASILSTVDFVKKPDNRQNTYDILLPSPRPHIIVPAKIDYNAYKHQTDHLQNHLIN